MAGYVVLARKTTGQAIEQEADRNDVITRVQGDRSGFGFGGFGRNRNRRNTRARGGSIEAFAKSRAAAVIAQLEGKTKGQAAGGGMFGGFGAFGRGASRPRSPGDALRDMIARSSALKLEGEASVNLEGLVVAARKLFARIDLDQSGTLARKEIAKFLLSQRGQNASPSEARRIQRAFDKDENRRLSLAEWESAFRGTFETWDRDEDAKLTRRELTPGGR